MTCGVSPEITSLPNMENKFWKRARAEQAKARNLVSGPRFEDTWASPSFRRQNELDAQLIIRPPTPEWLTELENSSTIDLLAVGSRIGSSSLFKAWRLAPGGPKGRSPGAPSIGLWAKHSRRSRTWLNNRYHSPLFHLYSGSRSSPNVSPDSSKNAKRLFKRRG